MDSFAHNGNSALLSSFLGSASAQTILGTNYVVIGQNYFTDNTQTEQVAIAIHEALHMTLGFDDTRLKQWLMNFGFNPTERGSHDITDWIVGTAGHMSTDGGGCKNP